MMAAAFAAAFFLRINAVWIIVCAAVIGVLPALKNRKGGSKP